MPLTSPASPSDPESQSASPRTSSHPIGIRSQSEIAIWIPFAFLLSVAMLEQIPAKGRAGVFRKIAIGFIAAIAAWASYWHLVEVATMGGADPLTAHALPLTVDAMMALASTAMKTKPQVTARRHPAAKKPTVRKLRAA